MWHEQHQAVFQDFTPVVSTTWLLPQELIDDILEYDYNEIEQSSFQEFIYPVDPGMWLLPPELIDELLHDWQDPIEDEGTSSHADFGYHSEFDPIHELHHTFGSPYFPGKIGKRTQLVGTYEHTTSTIVPVTNRVYYIPFYVPYPIRIVELGVYISTRDDASEAWLGVYNFDRGVVKEKIYGNRITLNTTTYRMVGADLYLTAGLYMLAFLTESSTVELRKNNIVGSIFGQLYPDGNVVNHLYEDVGSFAEGLPDTGGETIQSDQDSPRILVRLG